MIHRDVVSRSEPLATGRETGDMPTLSSRQIGVQTWCRDVPDFPVSPTSGTGWSALVVKVEPLWTANTNPEAARQPRARPSPRHDAILEEDRFPEA
jgi:hypothetical protein